MLVDERAEGDVGLLGEPKPAPKPADGAAPRKQAHFPTIRIGASAPDGD